MATQGFAALERKPDECPQMVSSSALHAPQGGVNLGHGWGCAQVGKSTRPEGCVMDQAAHHYEQQLLERQIEETIQKSMQERLTADDAALLAWATGVTLPNSTRQEPT